MTAAASSDSEELSRDKTRWAASVYMSPLFSSECLEMTFFEGLTPPCPATGREYTAWAAGGACTEVVAALAPVFAVEASKARVRGEERADGQPELIPELRPELLPPLPPPPSKFAWFTCH